MMRERHAVRVIYGYAFGDCGDDAAFALTSESGALAMSDTPPANPKAALRIVPGEAEIYDLMRQPETTSERVKRLQQEARSLAVEQVEALEALLMQASQLAREIAEGGDAYPVGARELAGRMASDLPTKVETLKAIVSRV